MSNSISSRSSSLEISTFINSQKDQIPVGEDHMPDITKAVNRFFRAHAEATITHVNTSLLDQVTIEYTEEGKKQLLN